jgi:hypothetical protein
MTLSIFDDLIFPAMPPRQPSITRACAVCDMPTSLQPSQPRLCGLCRADVPKIRAHLAHLRTAYEQQLSDDAQSVALARVTSAEREVSRCN